LNILKLLSLPARPPASGAPRREKDRYLARTGYEAQQTEEPDDPRRPTNLWNSVPTDHGAHGRFDAKSRSWSLQWWATTHRWLLGTIGVAAGVILLAGRSKGTPRELDDRAA
jgi:hypothetical protein